MHRKIIHIDLDAFFCAVEEQHDTSLIGKPFCVGGKPQERGVVSSCSYAARRFGVRSAMPTARAKYLCPEIRIISPNYRAYKEASQCVMELLYTITPLVEQISIDEGFLDVSELPETGEEIARKLQSTIQQELGLPCSLGIATNKLLAKIANDFGKSSAKGDKPPNAITVVPTGEEAKFLAPLPVEKLWGVGPKTAQRLSNMGIYNIGDLAAFPEKELIRKFGKIGAEFSSHARGIDDKPIVTSHELKSISQEITFARDVKDEQTLRCTLQSLSKAVGERLRKQGLTGCTIKLKLRWPDFTNLTRQTTLSAPTDKDSKIFEAVLLLFNRTWEIGKPIRLIGVGISKLDSRGRQLSLWDDSLKSIERDA